MPSNFFPQFISTIQCWKQQWDCTGYSLGLDMLLKSNKHSALIITQLMHTLQPCLLCAALLFFPSCLTFLAPSLVLILCNPNYIFVCACVWNRSLASESHHAWKPQRGSPRQSLASRRASPRAQARVTRRCPRWPSCRAKHEKPARRLWKGEHTGSCWSLLFLFGAAAALAY